MVALSSVEKELQDLTGIKRRAKEGKQRYLPRLLDAVNDLPDDRWDDVSPEGQDWANNGMKSLKKKETIPDFPDSQPATTEKPETKTKKVGDQAKKETKAKTDTPSKGIKVRIKEILLDNPKARATEIYDMLYKEGIRPSHSTVIGIRSEFRHTLRVLKSRGLLKEDK